jgi:Protein of unknown function (DUF3102)
MTDIVTLRESVNPHDDLDTLAAKIRNAFQEMTKVMRTAVRIGLDAGDALNAAKQQVPDGEWGRWLKNNCYLSQRTVQVYMQLANHRDEVETKLAEIPDLSLRVARKLIAKPAPQKSGENPDEDPAPATPKTKNSISPRELEAAQAHIAELEAAREHDRGLVAELKDGKALKAENDALRAALKKISTLLSEARALAAHLSHNRDAVLGKMKSAKTAADSALKTAAEGKVRESKKKDTKAPKYLEATATHLN